MQILRFATPARLSCAALVSLTLLAGCDQEPVDLDRDIDARLVEEELGEGPLLVEGIEDPEAVFADALANTPDELLMTEAQAPAPRSACPPTTVTCEPCSGGVRTKTVSYGTLWIPPYPPICYVQSTSYSACQTYCAL